MLCNTMMFALLIIRGRDREERSWGGEEEMLEKWRLRWMRSFRMNVMRTGAEGFINTQTWFILIMGKRILVLSFQIYYFAYHSSLFVFYLSLFPSYFPSFFSLLFFLLQGSRVARAVSWHVSEAMSTRISSTSLCVCVSVCVSVCVCNSFQPFWLFSDLYFSWLRLSLFLSNILLFFVFPQDLLKILTKLMTTCLLFADQMKRFISNSRVRQHFSLFFSFISLFFFFFFIFFFFFFLFLSLFLVLLFYLLISYH